jgi:tape measure domain-containing protein
LAEKVTFDFVLNDLFSSGIRKAKDNGKAAFDTLDKESDEFDKKLKRNSQSAAGVGSSLKSLAGLATKVFAVIGVGSVVKQMAELSMEAEQNKVAFSTFLGSGEKATAMLKDLGQVAATTPYGKREIIDTAKTLLGFGVTAEKMTPTLRALGDVSSGTGKNFKELAVIFGQVKSVGRLMGGDLMQLRQAGIPIVSELAKNFGVTESAITEMVSKGKIGFADVEKAFMTMTGEGGMFFNLMDAQSKTLAGRLSTLKDAFVDIGTNIGDKFIAPLIGKFLEFSNSFLSNLAPIEKAFGMLGTAFQPVIDGVNEIGIAFGFWTEKGLEGSSVAQGFANVITNYVVPAVQTVANVFKVMADFIANNTKLIKFLVTTVLSIVVAFKVAATAVSIFKGAMLILNAVMAANPIGLIITAVGALVGMFIYAWNEIDGFKEGIISFWESAKWAFTNLGTFVPKVLMNIVNFFKESFTPFFEAIEAFRNGEFAKAAKLAGKGILQTNPIVMAARLTGELFNGNLFKGTGADQVFNDTKNGLLREKKLKEQQDSLDELVKQGKTDATMASPANTVRTVPNGTGGVVEEAVRVKGDSPRTVTITNTFDIKVTSENLPDATKQIEEQFEMFVARMGNITSQSTR